MRKRIFVLGDSISMQYGPYLREMLAECWDYDRKRDPSQTVADLDQPVGGNGGDSDRVLEYLNDHCEHLAAFDLLLVNCGLHDIKTDEATGMRQVDVSRYEENLVRILDTLAAIGLPAAWVRTTPVDDGMHNRVKGFHRFNRDVLAYNAIADRVMAGRAVPELDLYGFSLRLGEGIHQDGVHFTEPVRRLQAAFLAGALTGPGRWSDGT